MKRITIDVESLRDPPLSPEVTSAIEVALMNSLPFRGILALTSNASIIISIDDAASNITFSADFSLPIKD